MLTQEQRNELAPLMEHLKYGKMLKDAMDVWSQDDVVPVYEAFGVVPQPAEYGFYGYNECCLIGACLLGKTSIEFSYYSSMDHYFNIAHLETIQLQEGFDAILESNHCNSEAYQFGLKIRNILNPKISSVCNSWQSKKQSDG